MADKLNKMNDMINKYIGQIIIGLVIAFLTGAILMGQTVAVHTEKLDSIEKTTTNKELVEEKLENIKKDIVTIQVSLADVRKEQKESTKELNDKLTQILIKLEK